MKQEVAYLIDKREGKGTEGKDRGMKGREGQRDEGKGRTEG